MDVDEWESHLCRRSGAVLTARPKQVHILVLSGDPALAASIVAGQFPSAEVVFVSKRGLREQGVAGQIRSLMGLRGEAFVIFAEKPAQIQDRQVFFWSGLIHRCRVTAFAYGDGTLQRHARGEYFGALGQLLRSLAGDLAVLLRAYAVSFGTRRARTSAPASMRGLAYIFPFPPDDVQVGGAMSHVRGFLAGFKKQEVPVRVFSGKSLDGTYDTILVKPNPSTHVFREAAILSFNFAFIKEVQSHLKASPPTAIYQRHGRYTFAGAVLASRIGAPLILEYNGSEVWIGRHWDPSRFPNLLKRLEDLSLRTADHIMVVSKVLRDELIARGLPATRIHVNANGVDPEHFSPGQGGASVRRMFGIGDGEVVAGFIGSFSYWHGVEVLQAAILELFANDMNSRVRFLLMGDGPLHAEIRHALSALVDSGRVIFTGTIPHAEVPKYLDACDILLSPHIPMRDGSPFFGSPTKLFEYMAMEKAIIASRLQQLGEVLRDQESAVLVDPGNASELAKAIRLLAADDPLRRRLGVQARNDVVAAFTWESNAARVAAQIGR